MEGSNGEVDSWRGEYYGSSGWSRMGTEDTNSVSLPGLFKSSCLVSTSIMNSSPNVQAARNMLSLIEIPSSAMEHYYFRILVGRVRRFHAVTRQRLLGYAMRPLSKRLLHVFVVQYGIYSVFSCPISWFNCNASSNSFFRSSSNFRFF